MKEQLLALLDHINSEAHSLKSRLTDAELTKPGAVDDWAVKDTFAHMTAWCARLMRRMDGLTNPVANSLDEVNHENADIFHEHHDKSWDEIEQFYEETHQALVARVQGFSENELTDPECFTWSEGRPLWQRIVGNSYTHPLLHIADVYTKRGDHAYALQLQEAGAQRILALDDSDQWRGTTIYNLACAYALGGQHDRAISTLAEALQLAPNLIEWSKEDPDFASIRENPAYLALYAAPEDQA